MSRWLRGLILGLSFVGMAGCSKEVTPEFTEEESAVEEKKIADAMEKAMAEQMGGGGAATKR